MKKTFLTALVAVCIGLLSASAVTPAVRPSGDMTRTDSVSAAIATVMGPLVNKNLVQLRSLGLDVDNAAFVQALGDYLSGNSTGFTPESADMFIEDCVRAMPPEMPPDTLSAASQAEFVRQAASTPGAVTLPGGVVFVVIQEGEGPMPVDGEKVEVSYVGKLSDGTEFDSTADEGPVTFDVGSVVSGFAEGLRNMRPGGTYRVVIPAEKAYGSRGIPGAIPGNAALDFTVTLVRVKK